MDVGEEGDLEWYLALHVLPPGHRFDYSFLISAVHKVLAVTRSTRSKDVVAAVQQFYRIGYQAAHNIRSCRHCRRRI